MRNPINWFREIEETWKKVALVCVFILIFTIAIEGLNFLGGYLEIRLLQFPEVFMQRVHDIDLAAVAVLFVDLVWHIYKAKNRIRYVKENWLLILSFVPFGSSIRALRFLKIIKVKGGVALKAIKVVGHASHVTKLLRPITQILSRAKKGKKQGKAEK